MNVKAETELVAIVRKVYKSRHWLHAYLFITKIHVTNAFKFSFCKELPSRLPITLFLGSREEVERSYADEDRPSVRPDITTPTASSNSIGTSGTPLQTPAETPAETPGVSQGTTPGTTTPRTSKTSIKKE